MARMGVSLYLIRARDIDLAFKIMVRCLLAHGLQLNQEAGRWGVRKRRQEWEPRPGSGLEEGRRRAGEGQRERVGCPLHAGLPPPGRGASELQQKLSGVFFLSEGGAFLPPRPPYHIGPETAGRVGVGLSAEVETVRSEERAVRQPLLVTGQTRGAQ